MKRVISIFLLIAFTPLVAWAVVGEHPVVDPPPPMHDPELGVPLGESLISVATGKPPVEDGSVDAVWEKAPTLAVPLHYGLHGVEPAGELELRSLYDSQRVYFLALWPAESPGGEPDVWRNLFTVHWRLGEQSDISGAETGSDGRACTVACHTATADGQGNLIGMRAETIPPGLDDDLPTGGGWTPGTWGIEWSRPRTSPSPYDQHMEEPDHGYPFFVKLFEGLDDRPDPMSDLLTLWLGP